MIDNIPECDKIKNPIIGKSITLYCGKEELCKTLEIPNIIDGNKVLCNTRFNNEGEITAEVVVQSTNCNSSICNIIATLIGDNHYHSCIKYKNYIIAVLIFFLILLILKWKTRK